MQNKTVTLQSPISSERLDDALHFILNNHRFKKWHQKMLIVVIFAIFINVTAVTFAINYLSDNNSFSTNLVIFFSTLLFLVVLIFIHKNILKIFYKFNITTLGKRSNVTENFITFNSYGNIVTPTYKWEAIIIEQDYYYLLGLQNNKYVLTHLERSPENYQIISAKLHLTPEQFDHSFQEQFSEKIIYY